MKKIILFTLCSILFNTANAQLKGVVFGYNEKGKTPISGAKIMLKSNGLYSLSDEEGKFEILLSKSHIGATKGKCASEHAKVEREKLEQIAAAVDSEDDSDCDSENGSLSASEKVRAQLRNEGAGKMEKIVSPKKFDIIKNSKSQIGSYQSTELPQLQLVSF